MANVTPQTHPNPVRKRLAGAFNAIAALALLPLLSSGALHAQEGEPNRTRANPAFIEWQEKQKERDIRVALGLPVEPRDSRLGRVPPPILRPRVNGPISEMSAQAKADPTVFPSYFDLRAEAIQDGFKAPVPPIRNQNPYGTCWAFGALASAESNIQCAKDLSEWHLAWFAYNPVNGMPAFTKSSVGYGEHSTFDQGGHDYIATAILSRGTGPVEEAYAPYLGATPTGTEPRALGLKSVFLYDDSLSRADVKYLVQTYGALGMSFYYNDASYHSTNHTFRYTGSQYANHAVDIVGWDDNFDRTKFRTQPSANGAWIVRNSWGTSWGEAGYFYMSYDSKIDDYAMYVPCSLPANQKIYQYDTLGLIDDYGYGSNTAWFSNIFTATGNESVTDVAFYTTLPNAEYEIYVKTGVTGDPSTGVLVHGPQTGTLDQPGYRQVTLSSPVTVGTDTKFAVIVKLKEQGYNYPINVTYAYSGYSNTWVSTPSVGYMSANGTSWTDAASLSPKRGICLKAFSVPASAVGAAVSVSPKTVTLVTGGTQVFTATVTGTTNTAVTWTASGGSITQGGAYTAPATTGAYTVTATSVADATRSDTATVTVVAPGTVIVSVSPKTVTLVTGGTQTFAATVTGATNAAVTWAASGGSMTQGGVYTAPAAPGTYTVTATSVADTTKSDAASVTVVAPEAVSVSVSPKTVTLTVGGAQAFATAANTAVTWQATGGSITQGGVYTAPATPGTYTVTATSQADASKSDTATVTVALLTIAGPPTGLFTGESVPFQAVVLGLSDTAVVWTAAGGGAISADGVFSAPSVSSNCTITATSVSVPSLTASVFVKVSAATFDGNTNSAPNLLGFANAFGSTAGADLDKYDFNGSGRVDDGDLTMLFTGMGW